MSIENKALPLRVPWRTWRQACQLAADIVSQPLIENISVPGGRASKAPPLVTSRPRWCAKSGERHRGRRERRRMDVATRTTLCQTPAWEMR